MKEFDAGQNPLCLLICQDLFFGSKVSGTAGQLGISVSTVASVAQAIERTGQPGCRLILLDLGMQGVDPAELMNALTEDVRPRVVAFGAHVHEAQLEAARQAGCDDVMPRSRFSATLPEILRSCLAE